jgi:hypothetical protein
VHSNAAARLTEGAASTGPITRIAVLAQERGVASKTACTAETKYEAGRSHAGMPKARMCTEIK